MKLSCQQIKILTNALHYLFVGELKELCRQLKLPIKGKKPELIQRIVVFLESGEIYNAPKYPEASLAKKHKSYPLHPKTLVLHGAYKNDLATRNFMKSLIGEHFHFTVYGQDWIKQKWFDGSPPTYMELASFWEKEYQARKGKKSPLKREWAYLNFIRDYLEKNPNSSQEEITQAWEKERLKQKREVELIVKLTF